MDYADPELFQTLSEWLSNAQYFDTDTPALLQRMLARMAQDNLEGTAYPVERAIIVDIAQRHGGITGIGYTERGFVIHLRGCYGDLELLPRQLQVRLISYSALVRSQTLDYGDPQLLQRIQ